MNKNLIDEFNQHRYFGSKPVICYAPFKNLYLTQSGDVCVCCNTRNSPVGKFPDQTIQEIWHGDKLKELREQITQNNLNYACELCSNQIESKNFYNTLAIQYDEFDANHNQPIILEFELDNTCNLECVMCNGLFSSSIRKNKENLQALPVTDHRELQKQLQEWIPFLKQAKFLGGEPFLIETYYRIWSDITSVNSDCGLFIQTNATVLNDKVKQAISTGNFNIGVSLDSLNRGIYESIRLGANFERVLENVQFFINYSRSQEKTINISVCPMRNNIKNIPEIIDFCNVNNLVIYFNSVSYPVHLSLNYCPSGVLESYYQFLSDYQPLTETRLQKQNMNQLSSLISYIKTRQEQMLEFESKLILNAPLHQLENNDFQSFLDLLNAKVEVYLKENENNCSINFYTETLESIFNEVREQYPVTRIIKTILANVPIGSIIRDVERESKEIIIEKIKAIAFDVV